MKLFKKIILTICLSFTLISSCFCINNNEYKIYADTYTDDHRTTALILTYLTASGIYLATQTSEIFDNVVDYVKFVGGVAYATIKTKINTLNALNNSIILDTDTTTSLNEITNNIIESNNLTDDDEFDITDSVGEYIGNTNGESKFTGLSSSYTASIYLKPNNILHCDFENVNNVGGLYINTSYFIYQNKIITNNTDDEITYNCPGNTYNSSNSLYPQYTQLRIIKDNENVYNYNYNDLIQISGIINQDKIVNTKRYKNNYITGTNVNSFKLLPGQSALVMFPITLSDTLLKSKFVGDKQILNNKPILSINNQNIENNKLININGTTSTLNQTSDKDTLLNINNHPYTGYTDQYWNDVIDSSLNNNISSSKNDDYDIDDSIALPYPDVLDNDFSDENGPFNFGGGIKFGLVAAIAQILSNILATLLSIPEKLSNIWDKIKSIDYTHILTNILDAIRSIINIFTKTYTIEDLETSGFVNVLESIDEVLNDFIDLMNSYFNSSFNALINSLTSPFDTSIYKTITFQIIYETGLDWVVYVVGVVCVLKVVLI